MERTNMEKIDFLIEIIKDIDEKYFEEYCCDVAVECGYGYCESCDPSDWMNEGYL